MSEGTDGRAGEELLRIEGLGVRYPDEEPCIQGLDLTIRRGEMVAIHGRSGCGKSTLISYINGIVPHLVPAESEGTLALMGDAADAIPPEGRCHMVGSLFQDFESQLVHTRVDDELSFGPANLNVPLPELQSRVRDVASLIGLDLGADPAGLSGGNLQRLCLGSALTMSPPLIVLDEPFSNIDVPTAGALMAFLRGLCDRGHGVLIAEHRIDLLGNAPDRVLHLHHGHLEEGPREQEPPCLPMGSPTGTTTVLDMEGIRFRYPGQGSLLEGVSLQLCEGESVVVLGRNGCGKSTLLRLAAGLLRPLDGRLELQGEPRRRWRGWPRGHVGLIWQNPNHQLFMDSVASELLMNAVDEDDVEPLLRRFGLWEHRNRHPQRLSEGQKRRLAVAAVLVGRPALLLMDEPTLGQDDASLRCMLEALDEQRRRTGMAMVSVTHDPRAARALGNRTLTLEDGVLKG